MTNALSPATGAMIIKYDPTQPPALSVREFGYQVVERHAPVTGQTTAGFLFQPDLAGLRLGVRLVGPDRG